ncbi:hypothetical protein GcM1_141003, partial [Golovinomyces cichoracearum]
IWEEFNDEFSQFSETDFKAASISFQSGIRLYLRMNGVWVEQDGKRRTAIAKSLYNTLLEKTPTEWTLEKVSRSNKKFDSLKILHLMKNAASDQSSSSLKEKATSFLLTSTDAGT